MARNASKLYYPIKESILSILPIVDEFVIALGKGDEDDDTHELLASIDSPKIKIIDTVWDITEFPNGMENAHQTDIAKSACTGDWLFYLQADELVHEKYHQLILKRCDQYLDDKRVEAFLFGYKHFWGDYHHYHKSYGWYTDEIRIVRNDPEIHSWRSAQSFRKIPDFDGRSYRQKENTKKLQVIKLEAEVYHYGWVRPPKLMQSKRKSLDIIHKGEKGIDKHWEDIFHYGDLKNLAKFTETHPLVMTEFVSKMNWEEELNEPGRNGRKKHKHERFKYRFLTFLLKIFPFIPLGSKNWFLLKS